MTERAYVVSRHFLRRKARAAAQRARRFDAVAGEVRVTKAQRGPFRWFVVRVYGAEGRTLRGSGESSPNRT